MEDTLTRVPDKSQHAVVASFVLEHPENPFSFTEQIAGKLRPGGQLIFSTLNVDLADFSIYREYCYDLDLPRHYTFFRKQGLRRMLASSFRIDEVYYQPAPNDYAGSARIVSSDRFTRALAYSINW